VHLLQHPAVFDTVLRRLQENAAPQPAANSRSPGSTAPDFAPIYAEVRAWPLIEAGAVLPGEREFAAG
jgi:hypothetical protein